MSGAAKVVFQFLGWLTIIGLCGASVWLLFEGKNGWEYLLFFAFIVLIAVSNN